MENTFLLPEDETLEIMIEGKRFRIKPLDFREFRKILELAVSLGLISAPFSVSEKTIKRVRLPVLSKIFNEIMVLTRRAFDTMVEKENPLAA